MKSQNSATKLHEFTMVALLCIFMMSLHFAGSSPDVSPPSRAVTRFQMLRRDLEWTIQVSPGANLSEFFHQNQSQLQSPDFGLQDTNGSRCAIRIRKGSDSNLELFFGLTSGGPLDNVFYRLSLVNQLLYKLDVQHHGHKRTLSAGTFHGDAFWIVPSDLTDSKKGFNSNGTVVLRLELSFFDGISHFNDTEIVDNYAIAPKEDLKLIMMTTNLVNPRSNPTGSVFVPENKSNSSKNVTRRDLQWSIKSSPNFNISQYLKESQNGSLLSPIFELEDRKNSSCSFVLRLHGSDFQHLNVSFHLVSGGGPTRDVHYRLSLVNQLLYREDSTTVGSSDSLQSASHAQKMFWNPEDGFHVHGVVKFKLEISFSDGIDKNRILSSARTSILHRR